MKDCELFLWDHFFGNENIDGFGFSTVTIFDLL